MNKIICSMIGVGLASCALAQKPAMVKVEGDFSVEEFKQRALVFADRNYRIAAVPKELVERTFLRTRIDGFTCTVTEPGELICLTPAAGGGSPCSQDAALSGYGFERMSAPGEFQLFGTEAENRVRVWRKVANAGEKFTFRKFACLLAQEARPIPKEPINIDVGRQLFLDDNLVETRTMKRKWIEPTIDPRSPVLKPETELERSNNTKDPNWNALSAPFSGGVWYDGQDKLYKCWYLAGWANGIAYATSMDGITWIRPNLDGKGNNLTYRTRGTCDSNAILLDPDCTDGYRWKGFAFDLGRAPEPLNNPTPECRMMGASVAVSKDGIHWTEPEQASRTGDCTTAFYNPFIRKWVYSVRSGRTENGLQMGRWRDYAEGDDFIRDAKNMKRRSWRLKGSAGGRQVNGQELYNFDAVAYESVMIGLALIFNSPQNTYWEKRGLPKIADLKLAFNTTPTEYDNWQFPWVNEHDGFFLSGTRKYGDWNMGYPRSNAAICIVHGDELWFYFSAFAGQPDKPKEFRDVNHKSGTYANGTMGIAKLRRDGFCSLSDGTITTRRLIFTQGDRLWINADVRVGELKVESSGGLARTFKGVDSTRLEVGRLVPGKEFTLTFTAAGGAKLYSFWTSDAKGRSGGYLAGGSPESDTLRDLQDATPPAAASAPAAEKPHFKLLPFNTEGTTYMKAGLCSSAVVGDFDGDGDNDVYLAAGGCTSMGGTWFFENVTPAGVKGAPTAFKPRTRRGHCGGGIRCELADGSSAVVARNTVNYDFLKNPTAFKPLAPDLPVNLHFGKVRANYWRLKDFDGDGRDDIVVGVGDWREYTWENRYTPNGVWTNAQAHGYMYVVRNEGGARGHEKWGTPQQLRIENGDPVEVFANASPMLEDWDGDGDLDIISGDFRDNWTFFENIGTRTAPVYTSGRLLHGSDGGRLRADLCITRPCACDWDRDGLLDFLSGEEDGRLGFFRNTGRVEKGMPVFDPPVYVRAARDYVHFGILNTPWVVDFDGDGDLDIISGNSAGYVAFIENLSGPGVAEPQWEEPKCLPCARGKTEPITGLSGTYPLFEYEPFRILAGPNGSIQGPCEAIWGYTCLSAEDWDGDGDIDVMLNNTWGKIILLRNIGTRQQPKLGAPEGVEVEWDGPQPELKWGWFQASKTPNAKEIVTQWRTTPVMRDMNGDGLMDLVLVDTEGYLAFFERFRKPDGSLALKAPRRAFLDAATGASLGVSGWSGNGKAKAGSAGRRKICFADWDGDGKVDLVMNSARVKGNAVLWRQTAAGNGTWSFSKVGDLTDDKLEWHSTSPCACDFDGDGVPDLLLGAEDGFFYHLRNPRSVK